MVDQIEHNWEMPPDPRLGCVSDDGRYLVVVDGGTVDAPGRYKYSIVDLETGESNMYDDTIDINVSYAASANIFAMNGYVWVVGSNTVSDHSIYRIDPISGALSAYRYTTYNQAHSFYSTFSEEHNSIYFLRKATSSYSSCYVSRFDCGAGTILNNSSNTSTTALFYSPQYDVLYRGASALDPITLGAASGTPPSLTGFNNTSRASGNKVFTRSASLITVHTDTGSAWTNNTFPNVASPSNSNPFMLGENDEIYTADNSKLYMFEPNGGANSAIELTDRGNRGTAVPVGNKVYIPASTRP